MPDPRVVLNRNSTFDNWTGSAPDNYTLTGTTSGVARFRRQDPRDHPQRAWFPKKLKSSGYIFDGESSFGWEGGASTTISVVTEAVPVSPLMKVSFVVVYKYSNAANAVNMRVRIFDAASSPIAQVDQNSYSSVREALPGPAETPANQPGRPASHRLTSSGFGVLRGTVATSGDFDEPYWKRYAMASIEMPAQAASADLQLFAEGFGAVTYLAIGEMRIEAVESLVTAGG